MNHENAENTTKPKTLAKKTVLVASRFGFRCGRCLLPTPLLLAARLGILSGSLDGADGEADGLKWTNRLLCGDLLETEGAARECAVEW